MTYVNQSKSELSVEVCSNGSSEPVEVKNSGELYSALSEAWANKMGESVDGKEYSSKHYASLAKESEEAVAEMKTMIADNPDFATVAGNLNGENTIGTVAGNIAQVQAIGDSIGSVNTVSENIADITSCAANITLIAEAPSQAAAASTYAQSALTASQNASVKAESAAISAITANDCAESATAGADSAAAWAEGTDDVVQSLGGVHSAKGWAEIAFDGQLQADWAQENSEEKDFIKNKPDLTLKADKATTLAGYGIEDAYTKDGTDARYLKLSGGTVSGWLGADGLTITNGKSINMKVAYNDGSGTSLDMPVIKVNTSNTQYGNNVAFGTAGGNTILGSGESATAQLNALLGDGNEHCYICSDGNIYLKTNCQTFSSAKTWTFKSDGNLVNSSSKTVRYITDTYQSGTSWYRVYNDNWCEQGGSGAVKTTVITFLKPFKNTSYFATANYMTPSGTDTWGKPLAVVNRTTTQMAFSTESTTPNPAINWEAKGYIS